MARDVNGAWLALGVTGAVTAAGMALGGRGSRAKGEERQIKRVRVIDALNDKVVRDVRGDATSFRASVAMHEGKLTPGGEPRFIVQGFDAEGNMVADNGGLLGKARHFQPKRARSAGSMARRVEPKHAPRSMVSHYLVTALWSSTGDDGRALDDKYDTASFTVDAYNRAVKDCDAFVLACEKAGLGDAVFQNGNDTAGHDFWLTRNHHGAGFWDGDYGKDGDALTKIANRFPEVHVFEAGRGKLVME